jgi:hypothetical protein
LEGVRRGRGGRRGIEDVEGERGTQRRVKKSVEYAKKNAKKQF